MTRLTRVLGHDQSAEGGVDGRAHMRRCATYRRSGQLLGDGLVKTTMNTWHGRNFVSDRFNPKTPVSLTAAWRVVIRRKKIKDMREAGMTHERAKGVELKKEGGPTTGLKASLLLEMLSDQVQQWRKG